MSHEPWREFTQCSRWNSICRGGRAAMNERSSFPGVTAMQPNEAPSSIATPQTLNDLQVWIHDTLKLSPPLEAALLAAIDSVFMRHERLWQESKSDAIRALSAGFS